MLKNKLIGEGEIKGFRRKGISNNVILVTTIFNRKIRKMLVVIALISMLWSYVPWNQINAVTQDDVSIDMIQEDSLVGNQMTDYPTTTDSDFDPSQVEIDSELDEERTLSSKTFRKIDRTYEIAMYNDVIHYEDEGKLKNIDNSLTYDENPNEYENKENTFKLKFPKKLDDNKSIKLSMDKYSIDWNVLNINEDNEVIFTFSSLFMMDNELNNSLDTIECIRTCV